MITLKRQRILLFLLFSLVGCAQIHTQHAHVEPLLPQCSDDLKTMTHQVVESLKKYPQMGTKPWDYKIAVKDLPCQVGSLTKIIMQLHGERYAHGLNEAQLKEKIADELADILSLVLFIAHDLNIDLKSAWNHMLKSDISKIQARQKNSGNS